MRRSATSRAFAWAGALVFGALLALPATTRAQDQYGVIVVNPARHPHAKVQLAQAFADWVLSAEGQATIAAYKIGGEQLFFPNAKL